MDIVDQAQEAEALFIALAKKAVTGATPVLLPQGRCYNCQSIVPPGARFCDADCRDDYATRKNSEARLGLGRR